MANCSSLSLEGMMRRGILLILLFFSTLVPAAAQNALPRASGAQVTPTPQGVRQTEVYSKLPVSFEPNQGQTDGNVKFLARAPGFKLYLTGDGAMLELKRSSERNSESSQATVEKGAEVRGHFPAASHPFFDTDFLRLRLMGADSHARVTGQDELPGKTNYFIGNDPRNWRTDVPNYAKVKYESVYPGIDLVFYGNQRQLEYDFLVAPGADPKAICFGLESETSKSKKPRTTIDPNGDAVIKAGRSEMRMRKPVVYQVADSGDRKFLEGRYVLRSRHTIGFEVASYDHSRPLVIDPALAYATFLGGSSADFAFGVAVDSSGNAYVVGLTQSTNFPTVNPIKPTLSVATALKSRSGNIVVPPPPPQDVFITKINAAGTALVYSTYLGGTGQDRGWSVAVDGSGNAYVTGFTQSTDFPTMNPIEGSHVVQNGTNNAFVTKLNPAGNALVYSTYLGGTGNDSGLGIAIDPAGNAYVTGTTTSPDFPLVNPLEPGVEGISTVTQGFVTKINAAGSAFVYSTLLAGVRDANAIAADSAGNAYVTGDAGGLLVTVNPMQPYGGSTDAFLSKINPDGSAFVYSTFLGGSGGDAGNGVAVDSAGNAYVAGTTTSTDFPTVNAIQGTFGSGLERAFVSKVSPDGSTLVYSTYLGGSYIDWALAVAVDASGNAYLTGLTYSADFPTTNAFSPLFFGPNSIEAYVTVINPAGNGFVYSSYLGGSSEIAWAIAADGAGNAYIAGQTSANGFPPVENFPTVMPVQPTYGGVMDGFVAKVIPDSVSAVSFNPNVLAFPGQPSGTISAPLPVEVRNMGTATLNFTDFQITGTNASEFSQTNDCSASLLAGQNCTVSVTFAPTTGDNKSATLTVTDDAPNSPQSVSLVAVVTPPSPAVGLSPSAVVFGNQFVGTTGAPQTVTLTNTGNAGLTISSIAVSASFAQTNNCGSSVAAGTSCTINLTFTPAAAGTNLGTLTITDNASPATQTVGLSGTGTTSTATLSVTALVFHNQILNTTSAAQQVILTNNGNLTLNITSIVAAGDFAQSNNCGTAVPVGQICTISVTFTPTAFGTRLGTVTLTDDAAGSPQTLHLTGAGILGPLVTLNPGSLNFPAQYVGTTSLPQNITLTNSGDQTLTISNVQATSGFAQTSGCTTSLAPGVGCTIGVFFGPTASGTVDGTVTITDNAPNSPQTVALSGTGQDFTLAAASGSTTSASVAKGSTATFNLSLAPAGGFSQSVAFTCTGAPSLSTCTVNPPSATLSPTAATAVTVKVATTAPSTAPPRFGLPPLGGLRPVILWWLALLMTLGFAVQLVRARRQVHGRSRVRVGRHVSLPLAALFFAGILMAALALPSCGGGGSTPPPPPSGGTPSGTYHLTVTGTFTSGGTTLSHNIQLTLTVN